MQDENQLDPKEPQVYVGMSHEKVIQPSVELVEEVRAAQAENAVVQTVQPDFQSTIKPAPVPTTSQENPNEQQTISTPNIALDVVAERPSTEGATQATQAAAVPSKLHKQNDVTIDEARATTVRSVYPEPVHDSTFAQQPNYQPGEQSVTLNDNSSVTLFSRVPLLRRLVFIGVGGATILILVLGLFRGALLNSLALLDLLTHGTFGVLLTGFTYASQVLVLVNLLLLSVLILSKSSDRVNKALNVMRYSLVLMGLTDLFTGNIVGIIFVVIAYRNVQLASAEVIVVGAGHTL